MRLHRRRVVICWTLERVIGWIGHRVWRLVIRRRSEMTELWRPLLLTFRSCAQTKVDPAVDRLVSDSAVQCSERAHLSVALGDNAQSDGLLVQPLAASWRQLLKFLFFSRRLSSLDLSRSLITTSRSSTPAVSDVFWRAFRA